MEKAIDTDLDSRVGLGMGTSHLIPLSKTSAENGKTKKTGKTEKRENGKTGKRKKGKKEKRGTSNGNSS